jgi:hypothetical protein
MQRQHETEDVGRRSACRRQEIEPGLPRDGGPGYGMLKVSVYGPLP